MSTTWWRWSEDPPPAGEWVLACQQDTDKGMAWAMCEAVHVDEGGAHLIVASGGDLGDPSEYATFWQHLPDAPPELQGELDL